MEQKRTVGPVTTAASAGAASAVLLAWLLQTLGLDVPEAVQGAAIVLCTALAGWLVKPGTGERRK